VRQCTCTSRSQLGRAQYTGQTDCLPIQGRSRNLSCHLVHPVGLGTSSLVDQFSRQLRLKVLLGSNCNLAC
jgi:hypothetical protein